MMWTILDIKIVKLVFLKNDSWDFDFWHSENKGQTVSTSHNIVPFKILKLMSGSKKEIRNRPNTSSYFSTDKENGQKIMFLIFQI